MSSLKNKDIKVLLAEFQADKGYFLDWSNDKFETFFEDFDIEIYDEEYSINGNSKGKRFKTFLALSSDKLVEEVLYDLRSTI